METPALETMLTRLHQGLALDVPRSWSTLDAYWPLLDRIRADGAIVVLKLDGERSGDADEPPYSVIVSGGSLGSDFIHLETSLLPAALGDASLRYARAAWPHLLAD